MRRLVFFMALTVLNISRLQGQEKSPCPDRLPEGTTCYGGRDRNGAYFLIAIPKNWNNTLILWNHGQSLAGPAPIETVEGLGPPVLLIPEGFAVAASTFRSGGFAVGESAEDTENLRQLFVHAFGKPRRTLVNGLSYGGLVTAKVAESYGVGPDGARNYDGALSVCGVLSGGLPQFYVSLDLRVVYQYYCGNHPRPGDEYELFRGLPRGTSMSLQELTARINQCTGILLPPWQRTETERRKLSNILSVMRITESFLISPQMTRATNVLQNVTEIRLDGHNAFSNIGVTYSGSDDDAALNEGVLRYASEPEVRKSFEVDSTPTGQVSIPVLTMHAIDDSGAFVEYESAYRSRFEEALTLDYLAQTFTTRGGHCGFTNSEFAATYHALVDWIETGSKPTSDSVAASCETYRQLYRDECNFDSRYIPAPLNSRVYPRIP